MENTYANTGSKPLQLLKWNDKIAKNKEWFRINVDYFIALSGYNNNSSNNTVKESIKLLYEIYNNRFPENWFAHFTDPLSAKNPEHKNFPAKIRPVNILRTNLDLLMGEYPRRPFIFQVNNMGDDGYSNYMEELNSKIESTVTEYFKLKLQQEMMEQGLITEDGQPASEEASKQIEEQLQNFDLPEKIKEDFNGSYRDKEAIKAQKWLTRTIKIEGIRQKFLRMFKDWLIAGQAYSFKDVQNSDIVYERISSLMIDYDKSPDTIYVEDGEWVCVKRFMTHSQAVDTFYMDLSISDNEALENTAIYSSPQSFLNYLSSSSSIAESVNKIPVWHVQWKGKKFVKFRKFMDPTTMQMEEDVVDEDYIPEEGDVIETRVVNEVYEGYRIGAKEFAIYTKLRPLPIQRNAMNNYSTCKFSYNGRKASDTHALNVSVMELGIPFQIMYIIVTRTLEMTLAKSKGKILLMDINAIPKDNGWDEEKFFYYSEAMGYGLLNRNQIGVDKSYNQYQVVDMTLFEQISQLIELQNHFKQEWDDIIGISRQRKGQTYASDLQGVNERAVFQSTVITDNIFNLFEEFTEKELQGLIDLSRFTNLNGVKKHWYETEVGNQLLEINPESYCTTEFGVVLDSSTDAIAMKNKLEAHAQAMVQNNAKPSTILEILQTQNISELKQKLKRIEQIQEEMERANQESEQKAAEQADERKKMFMEYEKMLDKDYMNAEYDRKEDLKHIEGSYNTFTFQDGDANKNDIPDAMEVQKMEFEREKFEHEKKEAMLNRAERVSKTEKELELKKKQLSKKTTK